MVSTLFRDPQARSSALAALGTLQPQAFGSLNCVETLDSVSNYYLHHQSEVGNHSYIYGAEYKNPLQGEHHYNVPCAVCYASTRETVLMIPAKVSCPTSWTREYYGYIMSARFNHYRSTIECVDKD